MKSLEFVLLAGCLAFAVNPAPAQVSGPLETASSTSSDCVTGGSGSFSPTFSFDGRFVVFTSRANNLVTNDYNAIWLEVFVRDLTNGTTALVSVNASNNGGGNGNSFNPVISSNGQFIAFESAASDLALGDTNGMNDVFVRDVVAGSTTLVSVTTDGVSSGHGASRFPVITPDGRWVAFESAASNLVAGDTNGMKDVFLRDLQAGTTLHVSSESQPPGTGSESASISADGQWGAFASDAVCGAAKARSKGEVYVRDFVGGTTIWASTNAYGLAPTNFGGVWSFNPVISSNGRFIAFKTAFAPNTFQPTATNLYFHDLQTQATTFVSSNVWEESFPEMTPDGRFVAFESRANVFVWDRQTESNTLVSVDVTGTNAANGTSFRPVLTPDGTKIAFLSDASNITTNGGNGQPQIYVRDLSAGVTRLVSVNLDGQPGSSLSGVVPSLTADGGRVAFWSTDERLVANDQNRDADVFLRELDTDTTTLTSAHLPGLPSLTGPGFILLSGNSVSADGRFVVLSVLGSSMVGGEKQVLPHVVMHDLATGTNLPVDTLDNPNGLPFVATNLPFPTNFMARSPVLSANGRYVAYLGQITTDNPALDQVYVRDLLSPTNWLASGVWNGGAAVSARSYAPSLSANGRLVAFQSDATNLIPTDTNGRSDIFVRNLLNSTNILVSVNLHGTNSANNFSTNPVISRDGRWVAFQSRATDLATNTFNSQYFQLFVRDLLSNTTALISKDANGVGLARDSGGAVFNPSGSLVLFRQSNQVFLHDLLVQTNALVCGNCFSPVMSADGRWVAYEVLSGIGQIRDIVLLDRQTGFTNFMSVNSGGTSGGNGSSTRPVITFDSRYVVFASRATNLVGNDTNGWTDIFVRDRVMNTTILASVKRADDSPANGASAPPVLGADGRTVAFQSFSSDLVENDFNNGRDVFVLRLQAGDTDGDYLPDDWELAYFGTLDRDGNGDVDGDGHTDVQEFSAGTDPTNTGSILRVLILESLGGNTTILWSATPGRSYRVQFKTNLTQTGWADLPGVTIATGSNASRTDNSGGLAGERFYRVVLVP